jgi:hypothetical protein
MRKVTLCDVERFLRGKKEKTEMMMMSQHRGALQKKGTRFSLNDRRRDTFKNAHTLAHKKTENSNDGGGCGAHWRRYFRERRLAFVVVVVGRGDDAKFEKSFE